MSRVEIFLLVAIAAVVIGVPVLRRMRRVLRAWREEDVADVLRECPELADIIRTAKRR